MTRGHQTTVAPVGVVNDCHSPGHENAGDLLEVRRLVTRCNVDEHIERPHGVD